METCKNKATGMNFIYLETVPGGKRGKFRLITPDGKMKLLNPDLFEKPEIEDDDHLLSHGLITSDQAKRYKDFFVKDALEAFHEAEIIETNRTDKLLAGFELSLIHI